MDGCFWHGCPEHSRPTAANPAWWSAKVRRNAERDRDTDARLAELGWTPLRAWEHEDPAAAAERFAAVLNRCTIVAPFRTGSVHSSW